MNFKYCKDYSMYTNIKWLIKDAVHSVKKFFYRMKYRLNGGYVCHDCGATIPIYYSELRSVVNGRVFMISNHSKHLVCHHCLAEKIDTYFANAELDEVECNWFPASTETVGIIGQHFGSKQNRDLAKDLDIDIRFGSVWWNGHYACNYAFQTALLSDKLKYSTGFSKYKNGKSFMVDRYGIEIERDF